MRRKPGLDAPWLVMPLFGGIGLISLAVVAYLWLSLAWQRATYVEVQGRVVEVLRNGDMEAPVVAYTAPDGREYTLASTTFMAAGEFTLEDRMTVRFPADAPASGVLDEPLPRLILTLVFGILGVVFTAIAYFVGRSK
jgi:hypothetical protein